MERPSKCVLAIAVGIVSGALLADAGVKHVHAQCADACLSVQCIESIAATQYFAIEDPCVKTVSSPLKNALG